VEEGAEGTTVGPWPSRGFGSSFVPGGVADSVEVDFSFLMGVSLSAGERGWKY